MKCNKNMIGSFQTKVSRQINWRRLLACTLAGSMMFSLCGCNKIVRKQKETETTMMQADTVLEQANQKLSDSIKFSADFTYQVDCTVDIQGVTRQKQDSKKATIKDCTAFVKEYYGYAETFSDITEEKRNGKTAYKLSGEVEYSKIQKMMKKYLKGKKMLADFKGKTISVSIWIQKDNYLPQAIQIDWKPAALEIKNADKHQGYAYQFKQYDALFELNQKKDNQQEQEKKNETTMEQIEETATES